MKMKHVLWMTLTTVLLLCLITLTPVYAADQKAGSYKNQLVKVKIKNSKPADYNYYYYNKNGKAVRNTWKQLKVNGKVRKMYFGKDGRAYKARKNASFRYDICVKKIGGKKYGFDDNGFLASGLYISAGFTGNKLYLFNSDGSLNEKASEELCAAAKKGADPQILLGLVRQYAGLPLKTYESGACALYNGVQPVKAIIYQFSRLEIQYFVLPDNTEVVYSVIGAVR